MAKLFVPKSSCIFAVIIFLLLVLSVGLLVFVLKGQLHHDNSISMTSTGKSPVSETTSGTATSGSTPKEKVVSKSSTTKSPDTQAVSGGGSSVSSNTPALPEDNIWHDFRLPKYIVPVHYDLMLHPDLEADTFTGTVNITVNLIQHTKHFVVHAYRLVIQESKVYDVQHNLELNLEKQFPYNPHEYYVLAMESVAEPGVYKLGFSFNGMLNGTIVGFYKSRYRNNKNETKYLATSKFQPTYARRAFPCFDEPSFKSTFTVTLAHGVEHVALSNMPVDFTEISSDGEVHATKFKKSVPMVTYLACFIVCDFKYQETLTSMLKPFRVYTTPDQVHLTSHALNFGSRVLEYFEQYFGIKYPLPKQDMVAIPDFSSGAMEHWGVITFRETNLLYDPEKYSPQNIQRIYSVIAHEMAHMWFGNLVTMKWWDDLWLNEGFASYVEYKGVDEQHPEWHTLSQFVTEELQPVMLIDAAMSSHPIVQQVVHPDEITEIFDDISYGKGASVLRMLEFFVGPDNFRLGISNFLKKYEYQNAETSDLWEELSEVCGDPGNRSVASIMKTWTEQMGFPYITIIRREGQNLSSQFIAKQRRFFRNEEASRQSGENSKEYKWSVPLSYSTGGGESGIVWLHDNQEMKFSVEANSSDWVKFNVNQTGFYLVNYDEEEWKKFTNILETNHEVLTPSDRSNLLFDSFLLAEGGQIGFELFFSMSKYLKNETHLIPWGTAYSWFVDLCRKLEATEVNVLLKSHIRDITRDLYKTLGWKMSDDHLENLLRTTIIGLACHSGNEDCLTYASEMFQNWTQEQEVPSNLRGLIFNFGMAEIGREEHWNYMWNQYLHEESPAQKKAMMNGLAHVQEPELILRYLEYSMDDEQVRSQDFFTILSYIAGNTIGRPLVWNFLKDKWPLLVERFTLNNRYLGNTVKKICSYFTTENELQEMREFFTKYPDAGAGKRRRQQALETVQNNIRWIKTYSEQVKTWLQVEGTSPWHHDRLPPHIVPEHYDLLLNPVLYSSRFIGAVGITVDLLRPADTILLHCVRLKVSKTELILASNHSKMEIEDVFWHEKNDYLVLKTKSRLDAGKYRLSLDFDGRMTESKNFGFIKLSYSDPVSDETSYLAVTRFAPSHARRVFPCFDEPALKATFNISLLFDPPYTALSNTMMGTNEELMPMKNGADILTQLHEKLIKFEKSLLMSTHQVGVIVCNFEFMEIFTETGIRLRVYTAPHSLEHANYSLNAGNRLFKYFEKYFGIPYPMKKLDIVGIPHKHLSSTENWGLIAVQEGNLLLENSSSLETKYRINYLLGKKISQMWFGNLVTMKRWNENWLIDGFVSLATLEALKHLEPEIDQEVSEATKQMTDVMVHDRVILSNPVAQFVNKGFPILRMLENLMGADFNVGISAFLAKFSFGNAGPEELWNTLTTASKVRLNVSEIMDTWVKQINFPVVTVNQGIHPDTLILQQHRFVENSSSRMFFDRPSSYNYVWQIPLTYRTSESNEVKHFLLNTSEKVSISVPDHTWIKFNSDFMGYYSVNYDKRVWNNIIEGLLSNHTVFSPSDRVNLLFDAFQLANFSQLDYDIPLRMVSYLKNETHHEAWRVALVELNKLKELLKSDREAVDILKEYIRSLSRDIYKIYGWYDKGDYSERQLRKIILKASCTNGNQDCLEITSRLYKFWRKGNKVRKEIKDLVLHYGIKLPNNEESWNQMWENYLEEEDEDGKKYYLYALSTIRNNSLIERLVEYSRNESLIPRECFLDVLGKMAKNSKALPLLNRLIFQNSDHLVRKYNAEETVTFVSRVFKEYSTEKDLERVRTFFKYFSVPKENNQKGYWILYNIVRKINWTRKHQKYVSNWLKDNVHMPWRNIRLLPHVVPTSYNISLYPNISKLSFEGEEEIQLNFTSDSDCILIHESNLRIFETELRSSVAEEIVPIKEVFSYKKNEMHVILLAQRMPMGSYVLRLKFAGKFTPDGRGMGRYQYTHLETGDTRYLLATRFEATFARRVFPCFDEPAMKSKFKLSITHDANQTAVSNMPEEEKKEISFNLVQTVFKESVIMSTYLLFCIVSDFGYLEADYKGKKVRAYAQPDRLTEAEHGLNLTVKILEKLEEFFDVPYVLPKLDSVAIPNYTVPGMEHWGVITYNNNRFLVNDSVKEHKRIVAVDRVIAHELVHQWFGNLVTMNWWSDLWLNEGVSTLIMYIPLKQYYPTIEEVDVRKMSRMMCADSSINSHPILQNAATPDEIAESFDAISYEKGAAVMKMLQYIMKDEFRIGLSNFLKKYTYKNAKTKDLWAELTDTSTMEINISAMMDTWTKQIGFPYISLEREGSTVTATQHWFSRNVNDSAIDRLVEDPRFSRYKFLWKIPLVYKNLATGNERTLWLNEKNATFSINAMKEDVIKFNPDFVGFYVVKYDAADWDRLGQRLQLRHQDFSTTDRYNLLHDAFVLAETDRLSYDIPLELSKYLRSEKEVLPWNLFKDQFMYFLKRLDGESEAVDLLKAYVRYLTDDLYNEFVSSPHNKRLFQKRNTNSNTCSYIYVDLEFVPSIVDLACLSLNEECMKSVKEELKLWMQGKNFSSDASFLVETGIPHLGDDSLWEYLSDEMVSNETERNRKYQLAEGLVSFVKPLQIIKTIEIMAFHPSVDPELARFMFQGLSRNPKIIRYLWNYTKNHWEVLMNRLDTKNNPSYGISIFCDKLKTMKYLGEFIMLMKQRSEISDFIVEGCIEEIQNSIAWTDKYEKSLIVWLASNVNL